MRGTRNMLQKLSEAGLIEGTSMIVQSSPSVAQTPSGDGRWETFLKPTGMRPHEKVYELTHEGKSFVAGDQELPARRVHQMYNRSHSPRPPSTQPAPKRVHCKVVTGRGGRFAVRGH